MNRPERAVPKRRLVVARLLRRFLRRFGPATPLSPRGARTRFLVIIYDLIVNRGPPTTAPAAGGLVDYVIPAGVCWLAEVRQRCEHWLRAGSVALRLAGAGKRVHGSSCFRA